MSTMTELILAITLTVAIVVPFFTVCVMSDRRAKSRSEVDKQKRIYARWRV